MKRLLLLLFIAACTKIDCDYSVEDCPENCVVCPPCEECSSLSCQTEEFCNDIGFDKDWYAQVTPIQCTERHEQCPNVHNPVCASVNVQCIKAPCNPVEETFGNACLACQNTLVQFYRLGECL